MAHLTLMKPMLGEERLDRWTHSASFIRHITARHSLEAAGSVSLLNVRVHSYEVVEIPTKLWRRGGSDVKGLVKVDAVLMDIEEGERIESMLPLGYMMSLVWKGDSPFLALHMCPLHLLNCADGQLALSLFKIAEEREEYPRLAGEETHLPDALKKTHFDPDLVYEYRTSVRSLLATSDNADRRQYMRLFLDIRNDTDSEVIVDNQCRNGLSPYYQKYNKLDTRHVSPAVFFDSAHPTMGRRYINVARNLYAAFKTVKELTEEYRLGYTKGGVVPVDGLDENVMSSQINFFRKALRTDKVSNSNKTRDQKKISGRWTVLEDDMIEFPAATRCTNWMNPTLLFRINRHTGAYGVIPAQRAYDDPVTGETIDSRHPKWWGNQDFMVVHRSDDLWRFIFVCHFTAGVRLGHHVSMAAIIPYAVEDGECSRTPRMLSPQRGMPRDVAKAIYNAPFCASAISHATSRLKYLSGHLPMLRDTYQHGNFSAHCPDLPILFRAKAGTEPTVTGTKTTNRSAVTRCISDNRFYLHDVLFDEVSLLPPCEISWGHKPTRSEVPVLGYEGLNPRALCLDE